MHGQTNIKFTSAKQAKEIHSYKNTKRRLYKTIAAIHVCYNKICRVVRFQATGRQHCWCIIPQAVNTVHFSWRWAWPSAETCWADWNY